MPEGTPGQARQMAEHLSSIVRAATAAEPGRRWVSALRCSRRPRHQVCPGTIALTRFEVPGDIEWVCTSCGDEGVISGWQRSPFDLRPFTDERGHTPGLVRVELPLDFVATLRTLAHLDIATERVVFAAAVIDGRAVLIGSENDFEELGDYVAAEANHTADRRRQKRLDATFAALRDSC